MGKQALIAIALALLARDARGDDEQVARELYKDGVTHYELAEYEQAIDKFKAAYALSHAPRLLFNIAQAYRLEGKCRNAVQVYRSYLRLVPDAENRTAVEGWLRELEPCTQKEPPAPDPTPPPPPPPPSQSPSQSPSPPPSPSPSPSPSHTARWALLGGGAALVAAGGGGLLWVSHDLDAAQKSCRPDCSATRDRLSLRADVSYVLVGVGGALAAAGVALWIRGDEYIAPAPGGVVVGGRF